MNFNYIESPVPLEEKKGTPLPPIGDKIEEEPTKSDEVSSTAKATPKDHGIPDVPIVFIMGKNCITKKSFISLPSPFCQVYLNHVGSTVICINLLYFVVIGKIKNNSNNLKIMYH